MAYKQKWGINRKGSPNKNIKRKTLLGAEVELKDGDKAIRFMDPRKLKANYEQIVKPAVKKHLQRPKNLVKNIYEGGKEIITESVDFLKDQKKLTKSGSPMSNPLNKNEFDIDYSGAEPVDLGDIPASDFTKAKKKLIEDYGGEDNPDYLMDKGDYYWSKKKGKIRSGYTEYPEDAGDIEPRYLGKNW